MLRGILLLLLAIVSLPLTLLYFLIRLTCGGRKPQRIKSSSPQARRIRASAEARSVQIRADVIAAAHARRQAEARRASALAELARLQDARDAVR